MRCAIVVVDAALELPVALVFFKDIDRGQNDRLVEDDRQISSLRDVIYLCCERFNDFFCGNVPVPFLQVVRRKLRRNAYIFFFGLGCVRIDLDLDIEKGLHCLQSEDV